MWRAFEVMFHFATDLEVRVNYNSETQATPLG
jgi:hypothetical protein